MSAGLCDMNRLVCLPTGLLSVSSKGRSCPMFQQQLRTHCYHTNPAWGTNLLGFSHSFLSWESVSVVSLLPVAESALAWVAVLPSLMCDRSVGRVSHQAGSWLPSGRWVESSARSESRCVAGSSWTRRGWRDPLITAAAAAAALLLRLPLALPWQSGRVGGPQGILEHLLIRLPLDTLLLYLVWLRWLLLLAKYSSYLAHIQKTACWKITTEKLQDPL